jgi:hypothetical protein
MFLNNCSGTATTVAPASLLKTNGRDHSGVQRISGGCASIPLKFKADCMVMVAAVTYRGSLMALFSVRIAPLDAVRDLQCPYADDPLRPSVSRRLFRWRCPE